MHHLLFPKHSWVWCLKPAGGHRSHSPQNEAEHVCRASQSSQLCSEYLRCPVYPDVSIVFMSQSLKHLRHPCGTSPSIPEYPPCGPGAETHTPQIAVECPIDFLNGTAHTASHHSSLYSTNSVSPSEKIWKNGTKNNKHHISWKGRVQVPWTLGDLAWDILECGGCHSRNKNAKHVLAHWVLCLID